MAIFETIFDICYLVFVILIGMRMLYLAKTAQHRLFGAMAVVLGCGDAFHLVPRIYNLWFPGGAGNVAALGIGQMITSVTMTVFYVLLYHIWRKRYRVTGKSGLTVAIYILAGIRILLCMLPQNQWTSADAPLSWGIYRNLPFAVLGIIIIVLFFRRAWLRNDSRFRFMWLAVTLSFAFYIPVVLFADSVPPIGALMMPKTLAYVWIVWMGYSDMRHRGF